MADQKVDTAADLEAAKKNLEAAQSAHDEAERKAAGPRAPVVVLADLLDKIVMRLGNRPELRALVAEFVPKEEPPPAPLSRAA